MFKFYLQGFEIIQVLRKKNQDDQITFPEPVTVSNFHVSAVRLSKKRKEKNKAQSESFTIFSSDDSDSDEIIPHLSPVPGKQSMSAFLW